MSFINKIPKELIKKRNKSWVYSSFDSKQTNITSKEISKEIKTKKVFFNRVEIIDVQSYKKYNQTCNLKLETIEKNTIDECRICNCSIF